MASGFMRELEEILIYIQINILLFIGINVMKMTKFRLLVAITSQLGDSELLFGAIFSAVV